MDQYITIKISNNLNCAEQWKMNKVITCFGSLFQYIYEIECPLSDLTILQYPKLTSLRCHGNNITDDSIM